MYELIVSKYNPKHVSIDTVIEFEKEFPQKYIKINKYEKIFYIINKLPFKTGKIVNLFFRKILSVFPSSKNVIAILMGQGQISKLEPYFWRRSKNAIYMFDCWEPSLYAIEKIINKYKLKYFFSSSKQSTKILKDKCKNSECVWVPEAITIRNYKYYHIDDKNIDVIQVGRKYDFYHQKIVNNCLEVGISYLYEKVRGVIMLPERVEFIEALARSKISICFSSDITHPKRSGIISTMTQRYLQSMASKCLIIGNVPNDMYELFDYIPIIEADLNSPFEQISNILKNFNSYQKLIEKNYLEVLNKHQWKNRIDLILSIINK